MPLIENKDSEKDVQIQSYKETQEALQRERDEERRKLYPGWYQEKERREQSSQAKN